MPLPRPLPDIQRELRELLSSSDIKPAFDRLQALLPQNTARQDELFLLLGRFNAIEQLAHQGVAPDEEILRLRNQLRHDLLHFVNQLGETDLGGAAAAATQAQPGAAQQGLLVYQVPGQMTLGAETRCLVRIALDRDVLLEDLDIVKHTRERALKKISKSMQVELADPSGGQNFGIRSTSKAVQTIDFDGAEHTEWRFYVTPLREGQHILEVKVSVIELVDGEKTYRERVLEEEVQIVSRAAAPAAEAETPFKPAGEALAFADPWVSSTTSSSSNSRGLRVVALFLVFLLVSTAATTWAVTPRRTLDWWGAQIQAKVQQDPGSYERFRKKYAGDPEARSYVEKAVFYKAELTNALGDWRDYLQNYPTGAYQEKALQQIDQLETKSRSYLLQNLGTENIRQFALAFPESAHFDEIKQAAGARVELLAALESSLLLSVQQQPTLQNTSAYLRYFPQGQLAEVAAASEKLPGLSQQLQPLLDSALVQKMKAIATSAEGQPLLEVLENTSSATVAQVEQIARQRPALRSMLPDIRATAARIQHQAASALPSGTTQEPDSDGDGVPNKTDACPNEKGLPANQGCPPSTAPLPPPPAESGPGVGSTKPRNQRSGLDMVPIEGGTFTMGCQDGRDKDCEDYEKPAHQVTLSGFQIGKYEVTQADWRNVMGSDPPELYNKGCDECPVEGVSWDDVQVFIQKLNAQRGKHYRLPTEAEWEYAARGGKQSKNYLYAGGNDLDQVAWYYGNYESGNPPGAKGTTHPVGGKLPNELGLYDMSGNVWECCSDWYGADYYAASPAQNPKGPGSGSARVGRGGGWRDDPRSCRSAYRDYGTPGNRYYYRGFRLALSLSLQ